MFSPEEVSFFRLPTKQIPKERWKASDPFAQDSDSDQVTLRRKDAIKYHQKKDKRKKKGDDSDILQFDLFEQGRASRRQHKIVPDPRARTRRSKDVKTAPAAEVPKKTKDNNKKRPVVQSKSTSTSTNNDNKNAVGEGGGIGGGVGTPSPAIKTKTKHVQKGTTSNMKSSGSNSKVSKKGKQSGGAFSKDEKGKKIPKSSKRKPMTGPIYYNFK